jgi:hypothetical protein
MGRSSVHGFTVALGGILALGLWLTAWSQNSAPQAAPAAAAPASLPPDAPKPPYRRLTGPETLNPGDYPEHWPYPDEYDSAVGAAEVHHIRYIDSHVRFVEVAYFPGVHGQMHGHPWFSVFAVDAPVPKAYNVTLDPQNAPHRSAGPAPQGLQFPTCATMNPQSPHAETNLDTWPHHFYRLEFLRLDGKDIQDHWKEWYPHLLDPLPAVKNVKAPADAAKFSAEWPYPIAYDSYKAAPNNNKLLYEDDHVRLIEVTIRPGETENMSGNPYPSVLAMDAISGSQSEDHPLDPGSPLNGQGMGQGAAPKGFDAPTCSTTGPVAPHAVHNSGSVPIHFYRIEFKRIDGDGLKTNWREWYPWMAKITDEYKVHPYVSNYY